jgi:hypothetical protein
MGRFVSKGRFKVFFYFSFLLNISVFICSTYIYSFAKSLVLFEQNTDFINLSRIDPKLLCAKTLMAGSSTLMIYRRGLTLPAVSPAVCLTVISVGDSFLDEPKQTGEKFTKMITGTPHSLEYERMVSVICVVYGVKYFRSQILGNRMTFSTRAGQISECMLFYLISSMLTKLLYV